MNHKVQRNVIPAFFLLAFFAPVFWMALDRQEPYVRLSGEITPTDARPGEFVEVKWKIKITKTCRPAGMRNISRQIVSASGHIIDYEPIEGVLGTDDRSQTATELVRGFQLPASIDPGPARYRSSACFACNPIQAIWPVCIDSPELNFNIVGKP